MRAYNFFTISILVLLMTVSAVADDWPNWRGPLHNGISTEPNWIGDWPVCEPIILWEQQVGTGFSSVVVADGRLYTMGNSERMIEAQDGGRTGVSQKLEQMDEVFCLDPNTGDILWIHAYPSP